MDRHYSTRQRHIFANNATSICPAAVPALVTRPPAVAVRCSLSVVQRNTFRRCRHSRAHINKCAFIHENNSASKATRHRPATNNGRGAHSIRFVQGHSTIEEGASSLFASASACGSAYKTQIEQPIRRAHVHGHRFSTSNHHQICDECSRTHDPCVPNRSASNW